MAHLVRASLTQNPQNPHPSPSLVRTSPHWPSLVRTSPGQGLVPDLSLPLAALPEGWVFTHLIRLGSDTWQVNLKDEAHVVVASGDSIPEAFTNALAKVEAQAYTGTFFTFTKNLVESRRDPRNLLETLGLAKPQTPLKRRLGL
jgi:hypothetical protein